MRNLTVTPDQQKHIQINYKLKKQQDLADELGITLGVLKDNARLMNLCTLRPKRNRKFMKLDKAIKWGAAINISIFLLYILYAVL